MARYIDADAVEERIKKRMWANGQATLYPDRKYLGLSTALEIVMEAPTAEVAEVVRCRECIYQNKGENESGAWNLCGYRPWQYTPTEDDHFCGYGVKMDEVTE